MKTAIAIVSQPSWERARDLLGKVRQSYVDLVSLGDEISALREQFIAQGAGGGRYKFLTSPARGRSCEKGWVEKVEEELGISNQAAYRIMEKAEYLKKLKALSEGNQVRYINSKNEEMIVDPTGDRQQIAQAALENVLAGETNAKRALVGVIGEGSRRDHSVDAKRAAPNYQKLSQPSAITFSNVLKHWQTFDQLHKQGLAKVFHEVIGAIPRELQPQIITGINKWSIDERKLMISELRRSLDADQKRTP